jgi:SET domain-containing protein
MGFSNVFDYLCCCNLQCHGARQSAVLQRRKSKPQTKVVTPKNHLLTKTRWYLIL